jgi:hypothetical protein
MLNSFSNPLLGVLQAALPEVSVGNKSLQSGIHYLAGELPATTAEVDL